MPPEQQRQRSSLRVNRVFLKSFIGILRLLQILLGAVLWATIAANKYEGSVHFVLFVSVFFWLLTLALYVLTLLDKQDMVPLLGGDRWLLSNTVHDLLAAVLYFAALGIMIYKTRKNSFCNLEQYRHHCLYKAYLSATVFSGLCAATYLLSGIYGSCRKCMGEQTLVAT